MTRSLRLESAALERALRVWLPVLAAIVVAGWAVGTGREIAAVVVAGGALVALLVVLWPERAALVLLAVLPFAVYPVSTGGFSVFLALPVALGIVAGIAIALPPVSRPVALPVVPYALLLVIALFSALHSSDVTTGVTRVIYLVSFGLLAWALALALNAGLLTRRGLLVAIVLGATLAGIALLAQFVYGVASGRDAVTTWLVGRSALFAGERGSATALQTPNWWIPQLHLIRAIFPFMSPPSAGQYMMLGLLAAVGLRRERSRTGAPTRWASVALVVCAAALLVTFSRQAWLGAVAGLLLLGSRRRATSILALLVVLCLVAVTVPVPGRNTTFAGYLLTSANTHTQSTGVRLQLWSDALRYIDQRPLLGVGPGLYATLNPDPQAHPIYYAHDIYLDAGVELGLGGAVALAWLLIAAARRALRNGVDVAAAMIVAYAIAGLFDDVVYFPRNGFLLAAAFALAASARSPAPRAAPGPGLGGAARPAAPVPSGAGA